MDASVIPPDFGFVVFVIVAAILMSKIYLGGKVVEARKKYEVPYPKMYSDHDDRFNCVQRAHQNFLEDFPIFLILIVFGGLYAPKLSAACGVLWIAARVAYAYGYYSGDPEKRKWGAFGYIGLITLLVNSILFGLRLLGIW